MLFPSRQNPYWTTSSRAGSRSLPILATPLQAMQQGSSPRRAAGTAAVMIPCPERLVSFVGAATRPGEAVTIAVSVLRAAEEAR